MLLYLPLMMVRLSNDVFISPIIDANCLILDVIISPINDVNSLNNEQLLYLPLMMFII